MDTGVINGTGSTNLNYGPGSSTFITIVMNEGGNPNPQGTKWSYTVDATTAKYVYATLTENTNETITPMKFAIPPFTVPNYIGTNSALTNQIFYLSEESDGLVQFVNIFL